MIERITEDQYRNREPGSALLEVYQTWEMVETWQENRPSGRFRLNSESTAHDVREFIAVQIAAVLGRYPDARWVVIKNAVELGGTAFYRVVRAEWAKVTMPIRLLCLERIGL